MSRKGFPVVGSDIRGGSFTSKPYIDFSPYSPKFLFLRCLSSGDRTRRMEQTRMENIRDRLDSVQSSFPYVVSCSGLSTLGGVESGIRSARDEIEGVCRIEMYCTAFSGT